MFCPAQLLISRVSSPRPLLAWREKSAREGRDFGTTPRCRVQAFARKQRSSGSARRPYDRLTHGASGRAINGGRCGPFIFSVLESPPNRVRSSCVAPRLTRRRSAQWPRREISRAFVICMHLYAILKSAVAFKADPRARSRVNKYSSFRGPAELEPYLVSVCRLREVPSESIYICISARGYSSARPGDRIIALRGAGAGAQGSHRQMAVAMQ